MTKKTEYLTVAEFAKRANLTRQAVYNQVDKKLTKFVKSINKRKVIDSKALHEVYHIEECQPVVNQVDNFVNQLTTEIAFLKEQISTKDKQIESLQQAILQAQALQAATEQKLLTETTEKKEKKKWWQFWKT